MLDIWLAVVLPFLLMVGGTRVTFSVLGASIVTCMVLLFALQFYEKPWYVIVIALISFTLGFVMARSVLKRKPGM